MPISERRSRPVLEIEAEKRDSAFALYDWRPSSSRAARELSRASPQPHARMPRQTDHHVLEHRHVAEQLDGLERAHDPCRAASACEVMCAVRAVDRMRPAVGSVDAGDDIDERGLAGAVRADQGVDRAGRDAQADIAQRAARPPNARDTLSASRSRAADSRQAHRRLRRRPNPCASGAPALAAVASARPMTPFGQEIEREQDETAVDDQPELVEIVQHLGQQREHGGADNRPQQGAGAAEQDGEQEEHRAEELEIVGTDVVLLVREQRRRRSRRTPR